MHKVLKNFANSSFSAYEKLTGYVNPSQANMFYAYVLYSKDSDSFTFAIKDAQSFLSFKMEGDTEGEADTFGVKIDPSKLFYVFKNYQDETLSSIELIFSKTGENPVTMSIKTVSDYILLPCSPVNEDDIQDILDMVKRTSPNEDNSIYLSNRRNTDTIRGIEEALPFVGSDDAVNNAICIYSDRVLYNDKRHIFVYNIAPSLQIEELSNGIYLPLHKKPARIITFLQGKGVDYEAYVSLKGDFVWITTGTLVMKINNTLCNVSPPSLEIFNKISPTNIVFQSSISSLIDTSSFFVGFFSSSDQWKPLTVSASIESGIEFELRNTKDSGSTSCNVKRNFSGELSPNFDPQELTDSVTVSNDSLLLFLKTYKGKSDVPVSWFAEDSKQGVMLSYDNKKLLLAKLVSKKA